VRRVAPLCLILISGLLLSGPAVAQPASTISPEELLGRFRTAEALADEGAIDPSPERMADVRRAIGLPVSVSIDGSDLSVPVDPVLVGLSGEGAEGFRRAADRIDALRSSLERAITATPANTEDVGSALSAAYQGVLQVDPGLVERIRRWIAELIQNLLSRLFSFQGAGSVVAWIVVAGLAILAVWLVRRLRLVPETALEAASGGGVARVDWIARAEDAFRAGDLHAAVHAFYRGLLSALSGRGLLIEAPGLTAGECRSTVREVRPELFDAIADATGTFEEIAYGGAVPRAADVDRLRRAVTLARSA
jgi:Domain of unknown function (DUF4129)